MGQFPARAPFVVAGHKDGLQVVHATDNGVAVCTSANSGQRPRNSCRRRNPGGSFSYRSSGGRPVVADEPVIGV